MGQQTIAFLMDPYETLNLATETSLLLIDELITRGHDVFWLEADDLVLRNNTVELNLRKVVSTAPFHLEPMVYGQTAEELDALVVRVDPPFNQNYLHLTYLLEFLPKSVLQINSPTALRECNEKLLTLQFPEFCPPTIVTSHRPAIEKFAKELGKIIVKPLEDCSGRGIAVIDPRRNLDHQLDAALANFQENAFVMAQAFLPGVARGDKRIFLVDGVPIGAVNRIPRTPTSLANIHQGAICERTDITDREHHICEQVGAELSQRNVLLAGLDFIDGYLTEVNITSPSAVRQINEVTGGRLETAIVDHLLAKLQTRSRFEPGALYTSHLGQGGFTEYSATP
ncbi:MAG: glutathione synthase [Gammaproteobacteria bacterium]|jgi:glutathione synthase|nr:glutathione synthase [Gammaproteobacteria bacterium]MBT4492650.1 glutathione synthase [Gammaproteobacteria bacterium]